MFIIALVHIYSSNFNWIKKVSLKNNNNQESSCQKTKNRVMGVYEQEGLGINHIRLKTLQQTMINYSTERGLQHLRSCTVYTSLPRFCRAAHTHCMCSVNSRQSHQGTWLFLHTDMVCLKKMKIFGRVFIRSEADTFATPGFSGQWVSRRVWEPLLKFNEKAR